MAGKSRVEIKISGPTRAESLKGLDEFAAWKSYAMDISSVTRPKMDEDQLTTSWNGKSRLKYIYFLQYNNKGINKWEEKSTLGVLNGVLDIDK